MTSTSISDLALPVSFPSHPSRIIAYTPLFLLPRILGNKSRWITCSTFHPLIKAMNMYLWFLGFQRWPSSQPGRIKSQWKILLISSSNNCEYILGYQIPSSPTRTIGSSSHFGQVSSHCWTTSSLNRLLSIPKLMTKQRSSIK
jgi:hypothetical protein